MSNYGWNDYCTTSPAERLRSQYKNLLYSLDNSIPTLRNNFNIVETSLNDGFSKVESIQGCKGVVPELLLSSLAKSKNEFTTILTNMETAISALEKKRATVRSRVNQLDWYCQNEDNREKEYSYNSIELD